MSNTSDGTSAKQPIFNTCLSYMKFLMLTRDRVYMQDAICARFNVGELQRAHKVILQHCDPNVVYNKRGPNKGPREKSIFFFEESYKLLMSLDQEGLNPMIACPAEELGVLLNLNGPCDHKMMEVRFQNVEEKASKISELETAVAELRRTVTSMVASSSAQSNPSASIPPVISERIKQQSWQSVNNSPVQPKPRSSSVSSKRRFKADSDNDSSEEINFELPKYNKKREYKKQKTQSVNNLHSNAGKSNQNHKTTYMRSANWGSDSSSSQLDGVVPELFIFNCRGDPEEGDVKKYLAEEKKLTVTAVKMMSPVGSIKRSFRVTVATFEDYEKLVSGGQYLPRGTAVKRFQQSRSSSPWATSSVNNLQSPKTNAIPPAAQPSASGNSISSSSTEVPANHTNDHE